MSAGEKRKRKPAEKTEQTTLWEVSPAGGRQPEVAVSGCSALGFDQPAVFVVFLSAQRSCLSDPPWKMAGLVCTWSVEQATVKVKALKTFMTLLFSVAFLTDCVLSTTPFYVDNGLQQTVILDRVPRREKRQLQQEILTLLGLHHRPKPPFKAESAPKFMLDLYETLKNSENEDVLDDGVVFESSNTTSRLDLDSHKVEGSDVIMSFVNHGE